MEPDVPTAAPAPATLRAVLLLWLSGMGLRITILAVPPVIQSIRSEFRLSATEIGLLSSIPPALFALNAIAGSLLASRLGMLRALVGGLVLVAAGSALRGASGDFAFLFCASVAMSAGVAIMQPVLPLAVRQWMPGRVGLGTAVYSNGLLVGELFPVWLTVPLVLPAVGGSWRGSLVAWGLPVAATAVLVALFAPRMPRRLPGAAASAHAWFPDWRSRIVWRVGATLGAVSGMYFATNGFLPGYLASHGRQDLVTPALTALNLGQIPASFLMLALATRLQRRVAPFYAVTGIALAALAGLLLDVGDRTVVYAFLSGFADATGLILSLTLPPLLCRTEDLARTSAGVFFVGYGASVLAALLSGVAWDVTGWSGAVFLPLFAYASLVFLSGRDMRRHGELA